MLIELLESDAVASGLVDDCIVSIDDSVDCVAATIRNHIEIQPKEHGVLATALRSLQLNEIDFTIAAKAVTGKEAEVCDKKTRAVIRLDEVADHATEDDCWIVLYDRVYDVTNFLHEVTIWINCILETNKNTHKHTNSTASVRIVRE